MTAISKIKQLGSGDKYFGFIVVSTALASIGRVTLSGFNLHGMMWALPLFVSILVLFAIVTIRKKTIPFPGYYWLPFFVYIALRTDFTARNDIQRLLIFATPVVIGATASCLSYKCTNGGNLGRLQSVYSFLLGILVLIFIIAVIHGWSISGKSTWFVPQGMGMTLTLIGVVAANEYAGGHIRGLIAIVMAWVLCVLTESRMAVLIMPIIAIFIVRGMNLRKRLIFILLFVVSTAILFNTEEVQTSLFRKGYGTVVDLLSLDPSLIRTGGRLTAWPQYMQNLDKNWFGSGGTASVDFGNITFGRWSHPHNEYIRILYDYGIVGSILVLIPLIVLLIQCHRGARSSLSDVHWFFSVGRDGIIVMFLLALTGNVLMYVAWFGNLLFATIGVAYRMKREY